MRTRFGDPLADLFSVHLVAGDQTGILLLQRVVPLADIVGVMPVAIVSASKKVHLFDDEGKLAGTSGTGEVESHLDGFRSSSWVSRWVQADSNKRTLQSDSSHKVTPFASGFLTIGYAMFKVNKVFKTKSLRLDSSDCLKRFVSLETESTTPAVKQPMRYFQWKTFLSIFDQGF